MNFNKKFVTILVLLLLFFSTIFAQIVEQENNSIVSSNNYLNDVLIGIDDSINYFKSQVEYVARWVYDSKIFKRTITTKFGEITELATKGLGRVKTTIDNVLGDKFLGLIDTGKIPKKEGEKILEDIEKGALGKNEGTDKILRKITDSVSTPNGKFEIGHTTTVEIGSNLKQQGKQIEFEVTLKSSKAPDLVDKSGKELIEVKRREEKLRATDIKDLIGGDVQTQLATASDEFVGYSKKLTIDTRTYTDATGAVKGGTDLSETEIRKEIQSNFKLPDGTEINPNVSVVEVITDTQKIVEPR